MKGELKWKYWLVQSLTFGRIPLILIFLGVNIVAARPLSALWFSVALVAMALSAVTDLFDGYLARKFGVTSRLGAYADPLTDKVFYLTSLPALVYLAAIDGDVAHAKLLLGMTVIFLMRDQWVSFLRSIGSLHDVDAKANWSGKARTVISFPAICAIYYYIAVPGGWPVQIPASLIYGVEIACIVINVISLWVYTAHYWPCLKKESSGEEVE